MGMNLSVCRLKKKCTWNFRIAFQVNETGSMNESVSPWITCLRCHVCTDWIPPAGALGSDQTPDGSSRGIWNISPRHLRTLLTQLENIVGIVRRRSNEPLAARRFLCVDFARIHPDRVLLLRRVISLPEEPCASSRQYIILLTQTMYLVKNPE